MRVCSSALPRLSLNVTSPPTSASLSFTIARQNRPANSNFRIHAPKFPKPQTEGFFVILGDKKRDEIFALKRVGWPTGVTGPVNTNVKLDLPPELGANKATLWCVSDGYVGVEIEVEVELRGTVTAVKVEEAWAEKPTGLEI
jgi:antiviral helicase SLH1